MMVKLRFGRRFNTKNAILRNVTEIHYNFRPAIGPNRIAFESLLHITGIVYDITDIEEMEVFPETEKAENF